MFDSVLNFVNMFLTAWFLYLMVRWHYITRKMDKEVKEMEHDRSVVNDEMKAILTDYVSKVMKKANSEIYKAVDKKVADLFAELQTPLKELKKRKIRKAERLYRN